MFDHDIFNIFDDFNADFAHITKHCNNDLLVSLLNVIKIFLIFKAYFLIIVRHRWQ